MVHRPWFEECFEPCSCLWSDFYKDIFQTLKVPAVNPGCKLAKLDAFQMFCNAYSILKLISWDFRVLDLLLLLSCGLNPTLIYWCHGLNSAMFFIRSRFSFYINLFYLFVTLPLYLTENGEAGAVPQTALSLIDSVTAPFPPNLQQTVIPKPLELGCWNFERMFTFLHLSHVTCHMSRFTCHMSRVTCHMSGVTWNSFFLDKVVKLVVVGSVINGAFPV